MSMWLVLGKKKLGRGTLLLLWEEWIGLCWTDSGIKAISLFSSICLCCYGFWAGINSAKPGQPVINIMMMMSIWTGLDHVPTDCRSSEMPILLHIVWTWTPTHTHSSSSGVALTEEVGILWIYQDTTNWTQIFSKRWQKSYLLNSTPCKKLFVDTVLYHRPFCTVRVRKFLAGMAQNDFTKNSGMIMLKHN